MILQLNDLKQFFSIQDYPCTIVATGGLATITIGSHNYKTGDTINITGTNTVMDGKQLIARPNANILTFATSYVGTANAIVKNYDEMLNQIINQVQGYIANYCNIEFGNTQEMTESHDLKVDGIIYPKRGYFDESNIVSIKLSRQNNFTDPTKFIELTQEDFYVYDDRIELRFDKATPYLNSKKGVKLTYTTKDTPIALTHIASQIAEYYFRIYNDKSIAESSRSINGDQRAFAKTLPDQINIELDKFVRLVIGDPF